MNNQSYSSFLISPYSNILEFVIKRNYNNIMLENSNNEFDFSVMIVLLQIYLEIV